MRASELQLRTLFENANDSIFLMSGNKIIDCNAKTEEMFGCTREEILQQTPYDLSPPVQPDGRDSKCESLKKIKAAYSEETQLFEWEHLRSDGTPFYAEISLNMLDSGDTSILQAIVRDISERRKIENALRLSGEQLSKINSCLLDLGVDYEDNMSILTTLCGELLDGTCALYNRLNGDMLCSVGQWHTPPDYASEDYPEGHICYDVIKNGVVEPLLVRHLNETSYVETDPNVTLYGLQTYVGHPVMCCNEAVGSLCVVYQDDVELSENYQQTLGIIASAIGREEERNLVEGRLQESLQKYETLILSSIIHQLVPLYGEWKEIGL